VLLALVHVSLWVKRRWWDARDAQLAAEGVPLHPVHFEDGNDESGGGKRGESGLPL
jgi:hypothetical protein